MAVSLSLNTPLADALSDLVQPKLSEIGWNTGGLDDSALGEYIILMLVNGKTQDQIAAELSNDLLNLDPDNNQDATDFSRWLFEQVESLNNQLKPSLSHDFSQTQTHKHSSQPEPEPESLSRLGNGGTTDARTVESMEDVRDGAIPTGPKSMRGRNETRNGNRRLMGQLSKAMDRSNDAVLHRIRLQQGTERINVHNKQPPKGPRNDLARNSRIIPNGRHMDIPSSGMPLGLPGAGQHLLGPQMTPQQQMQLFAMYEEQARMMSQIFSPQQQQMFMPGLHEATINHTFQNRSYPQPQQPVRSLFDRIEPNPERHNENHPRHVQQTGSHHRNRTSHAAPAPETPLQTASTGELPSSMEVESPQPNSSEQSADAVCKFNLSCTKKDCPFAHQSPAAPPGIVIDVNDQCPFGAACKNRKCVARHPSPAQKITHQAEQDCKFFPNCTNPACPFRHPTMPMCRNGADCSREGCKFTHIKILCKYNPCLNSTCPYKHVEGQKRGVFNDKVWTAEGSQEKSHVSERKFVDDDMGEEELIIPENRANGSRHSSPGAEVVT